jgi:hypothetical protein
MLFLMSERGLPLLLSNGLPLAPTLTVELYEKWYTLYLVKPNGDIEVVEYPDDPASCPSDMSPYMGHVPNSKVVANYARNHGYEVDLLAFELIVGRWEIERREFTSGAEY